MLRAVVSNSALPTTSIGSWTNRLTQLINNNPSFFNYILSPTALATNNIFCKKRQFITWRIEVRHLLLRFWVARDYILALKNNIKDGETWTIVIMDDLHLLEAIVWANQHYGWQAKVAFSFHGFNLNLNPKLVCGTHQILFLSQLAKQQFLKSHTNYKNSTVVVGNAVDSKIFYPLTTVEKNLLKKSLGYNQDDIIIIWMAKDRPKKGFELFKLLVQRLWQEHPQLKVITIGTRQAIKHSNERQLGLLPNAEVVKYLQISNIYTFTTQYNEGFGLSMVEAYKCGNVIVASNLGAIPEVLNGLPNTHIINQPLNVDEWFNTCNDLINSFYSNKSLYKNSTNIWEYNIWESKFKNALNF
jgi:glycosyltransferase involved in cell wall biosynthesis